MADGPVWIVRSRIIIFTARSFQLSSTLPIKKPLLYYALFVIVIELTALAGMAEVQSRHDSSRPGLWISHVSLIVISRTGRGGKLPDCEGAAGDRSAAR